MRLTKFIDSLSQNSETVFGTFLKLGGSKGQVLGVLKQSKKLQYCREKKYARWRKLW